MFGPRCVFSDGWFYPHSFHLKLVWEFHDMGTSAWCREKLLALTTCQCCCFQRQPPWMEELWFGSNWEHLPYVRHHFRLDAWDQSYCCICAPWSSVVGLNHEMQAQFAIKSSCVEPWESQASYDAWNCWGFLETDLNSRMPVAALIQMQVKLQPCKQAYGFLKGSSYCNISAVMFSVWRVAEAWHWRLMYMEGSCYVAIADIEGCCCVAASDEEGSWKDVVVLQQQM